MSQAESSPIIEAAPNSGKENFDKFIKIIPVLKRSERTFAPKANS
jgi:hypothetical protein